MERLFAARTISLSNIACGRIIRFDDETYGCLRSRCRHRCRRVCRKQENLQMNEVFKGTGRQRAATSGTQRNEPTSRPSQEKEEEENDEEEEPKTLLRN